MDQTTLAAKWTSLNPLLDERARRIWAATEAVAIGRSGVTLVAEVTGLSRTTIHAGIKELDAFREGKVPAPEQGDRLRASGSGRKRLALKDATLIADLELLVDPAPRGDPGSPLRWTSRSTIHLAKALQQRGHRISPRTVAALLIDQGYSLQANRKSRDSGIHPDRDQQFAHINDQAKAFQKEGQPVISVDTRKRELIGTPPMPEADGAMPGGPRGRSVGKAGAGGSGPEWPSKGKPERASTPDAADRGSARAIPCAFCEAGANLGWMTVGSEHDTPKFAVNSIRTWWEEMGRPMYPKATRLLVLADCGGGNSYRSRAWKLHLQQLADETRLEIAVCHFPPGTSRWNRIEHRMFCHITQDGRGRPLVSLEVVVHLIGTSTPRKGLKARASLDPGKYLPGAKVRDEELALVRLKPSDFQGAWNYAIQPR